MEDIQIKVGFAGRDELFFEGKISGGQILSANLKGIGCPAVLNLISRWRPAFTGHLADLPEPEGTDHASLLLKELVLKLKNKWDFPYKEEELCHCRAVGLKVVDAAIVYGAETVAQVAAQTSAGTGCGSCRKNTQAIIKYRRGGEPT